MRDLDVTDCVQAPVRNPDGSIAQMFVPALAGFMVAQALQQRSTTSGGGGGGGGFYASRNYPNQYRDVDNLTANRGANAASPFAPTTTAPSRAPNVQTTTIARSGFGSTSSFHGGGSS